MQTEEEETVLFNIDLSDDDEQSEEENCTDSSSQPYLENVSKRQGKKLQAREQRKDYFKMKKDQKKLEKKQRRADKKEQEKQLTVNMTQEELQKHQEKKMQNSRTVTANRAEYKRQRVRRLTQILEEGPDLHVSIAIDCSMNDYMHPRELVSLSQQLMFGYAVNSVSNSPVYFALTSLEGSLLEECHRLTGFSNWLAVTTQDHYTKHFHKQFAYQKIIYLTADAEEVIDSVESGTVYVIGGIVDRNRHKNLCRNKAIEDQVRMARLPIEQYLDMAMAPVLTVNQCVEMLIEAKITKCWKAAVEKVVPPRKRKKQGEDETVDKDN